MYSCPSCHEKGISFWSKQFYTAWTLPKCRNCGEKFTVSMLGVVVMAVLLPLPTGIVAIATVLFVNSIAGPMTALIAALIVMYLIASAAFHLLPLRPKQRRA